jgi:hypothetical protein
VDPSFDQKMATGRNGSSGATGRHQPDVGFRCEAAAWHSASQTDCVAGRLQGSFHTWFDQLRLAPQSALFGQIGLSAAMFSRFEQLDARFGCLSATFGNAVSRYALCNLSAALLSRISGEAARARRRFSRRRR